jgi:hypothetical protein
MRTGGVEPPQREATALQAAELTGAQRPRRETEGGIGSPQPLRPALCTSPCSVTSSAHPSAGRSWSLRGWDSNPRSRAHEARGDNRSPTARSGWLESNQRSPVPETGGVARLPHSQVSRRPWNRTTLYRRIRAGPAQPARRRWVAAASGPYGCAARQLRPRQRTPSGICPAAGEDPSSVIRSHGIRLANKKSALAARAPGGCAAGQLRPATAGRLQGCAPAAGADRAAGIRSADSCLAQNMGEAGLEPAASRL